MLVKQSPIRLLKKASSKAAGSEDPEAYLWSYVEGFDGYPLPCLVQWVVRTKLEGFFSSLRCEF